MRIIQAIKIGILTLAITCFVTSPVLADSQEGEGMGDEMAESADEMAEGAKAKGNEKAKSGQETAEAAKSKGKGKAKGKDKDNNDDEAAEE